MAVPPQAVIRSFRQREEPGDRVTALIEDTWCEKIRGCSLQGGDAYFSRCLRC